MVPGAGGGVCRLTLARLANRSRFASRPARPDGAILVGQASRLPDQRPTYHSASTAARNSAMCVAVTTVTLGVSVGSVYVGAARPAAV